jgi:hypothetical protein
MGKPSSDGRREISATYPKAPPIIRYTPIRADVEYVGMQAVLAVGAADTDLTRVFLYGLPNLGRKRQEMPRLWVQRMAGFAVGVHPAARHNRTGNCSRQRYPQRVRAKRWVFTRFGNRSGARQHCATECRAEDQLPPDRNRRVFNFANNRNYGLARRQWYYHHLTEKHLLRYRRRREWLRSARRQCHSVRTPL